MNPNQINLEAKARALLDRIDRDEDVRGCYVDLKATIEDFQRSGSPIPQQLAQAKRHLELELAAQSQGR